MLTYSFADGNGDGYGDFKGIIDHLDYLEGLGIGGIWLSPFHPAVDYHGYNITDYYSVNPILTPTVDGATYTLDKLIEACHARDIKVLMDGVFNHSSDRHPWHGVHPDWYGSVNFFGDSFPEFNYDVAAVREEIKNVGKYWVGKGIDGFRLDAAQYIYNSSPGQNVSSSDMEKTIAWWKEFATAVRTVNPDVYLVAEILTGQGGIAVDYHASKAGSNFDFPRIERIKNAVAWGDASSWADYCVSIQNEIRNKDENAIEASLLSNHDIGRFAFNYEINDATSLKFANALNILAPGGSFVYYGEELGMNGTVRGGVGDDRDLNARTPMPFVEGRTDSLKYLGNFYGVDARSTTTTVSNKTADEDSANRNSMYSYTSRLIKFKNNYPDLFNGQAGYMPTGLGSLGAIHVNGKTGAFVIVANADSSPVSVTLNGEFALFGDFSTSGKASIHDDTLNIPGKSVVVLATFGLASFTNAHTNSSYSEPASSQYLVYNSRDGWGERVDKVKEGEITLHYFNKETSLDTPTCYSWIDTTPYLGKWPGTAMTSEGGNWYKVTVPLGAANVIFTNKNGTKQTEDLFRPQEGEYWFVPAAGTSPSSGHWFTSNPIYNG